MLAKNEAESEPTGTPMIWLKTFLPFKVLIRKNVTDSIFHVLFTEAELMDDLSLSLLNVPKNSLAKWNFFFSIKTKLYKLAKLVYHAEKSNVFIDLAAFLEYTLLIVLSTDLLLCTTQKLSTTAKNLHLLL